MDVGVGDDDVSVVVVATDAVGCAPRDGCGWFAVSESGKAVRWDAVGGAGRVGC